MELNRREFLKLLGVTGAATAVGAWSASALLSVPDEMFQRMMNGPHLETFVNSICTMCPGGCGIKVRRIDGIPVRVTGNPFYPINQGAVCPKAEASIALLFHPKRIRQPQKRIGQRGENQWQAITWDEATRILTDRLLTLQNEQRQEQLVLVSKDQNTMLNDLSARFMQSFGSPNFINLTDTGAFTLPALLSQGLTQPPAYDLNNADYILNFGGDFLDEGPSPVRFNQIYVNLRTQKDNNKAEIIHIGSYMSRTAANSTRWIQIKPGTMAALALGIANVMIRDKSFDRDFIQNSTFGFHDWKDKSGHQHQGFEQMVTADYYPDKVTEITGIPAHTIVTIAREFAVAKKPIALAGNQAAQSTNSLYSLWAIYCLNALSGNFNQTGGVIFPSELPKDFLNTPDTSGHSKNDKTKNGLTDHLGLSFTLNSFEQILKAIDSNTPYPVDTLILHDSNPISESANYDRSAAILQKIPFIVSCTSFMSESALLADLILPESNFLESWEISRSIPLAEFSHFGVQQPVVEPLYDTLHFADILFQIDKHLNSNNIKLLPWENYKSYLQAFAHDIFTSGEGVVISEKVNISWIQYLKERGFQIFDYSNFEEFWDRLVDQGGWWNPAITEQKDQDLFNNGSGKFEFYSLALKAEIEKLNNASPGQKSMENLYDQWKISAREDLVYLPHFEEPRFDPPGTEYPLLLLRYNLMGSNWNNDATLGLLQELSGIYSREFWHLWVEINPETAHTLQIKENEYIRITAAGGHITLKAKILPTVMPDVIMIPNIRSDDMAGSGFHAIATPDMDYMSGTPSYLSTRVRISKRTTSIDLT